MEEQQEERIIKHPLLPPNYVTLVQLQERWVKEQQRKQREKEDEEERKRREKEDEEERKPEDQVNQKKRQNGNGVRIVTNTLSCRRPVRRDRTNQLAKRCGTIGVMERKPEESESVEIVVDDGERKIDDLKKNRKNKNKKKREKNMRGKPRAEEDLTGGTEQLLPVHEEAAEKNPVVSTEREGEKKKATSEFRRNGKQSAEKKAPVDRSSGIRRNFEDLSLNGGKGGNSRHGKNMHGGQWKYYTGSGRFNDRRMQRPIDSNLVWVRKGDSSDINFSGVRSSGGELF